MNSRKGSSGVADKLDHVLQKTSISEQVEPALSVPQSSSRNDIFSAASPVLQPAPRLPSVSDHDSKPRKSSTKQADFFFGSSASLHTASPQTASAQPTRSESMASIEDADRPGYGRSNSGERERERESIRQTSAKIEFRLCPIKEFMLGEGRHSNVYLGSYRIRRTSEEPQVPESERDQSVAPYEWRLCAVKRPHPDHQAQLLALEEAFALRRLGPHPNIVELITIRDEVEWAAGISTGHTKRSEKYPGDGNSFSINLRSPLVEPPAASSHARSTSDTYTSDKEMEKGRPIPASVQHRRMVSQPQATSQFVAHPTVKIVAPEDEATRTLDGQQNSLGDGPRVELPRLLMLMELLPFSMSSFARRNPELVDYEQWKMWALELASVVEWMHKKGCIHADLKPENVLLTTDLHVKICDFNSALFPNPSTPLMDGMGLGTPAYGAPELSRSGSVHSRGAYKGFSFPVDVWSLGAILYSLATGVEPFRRARSMIDIVYRKRVFFESEENDRVARMSVAEGSSTAGPGSHYGGIGLGMQGSLPASRNGSLRGRKSDGTALPSSSTPSRSHGTMHRRAPSSESVSSVASSVVLSGTSGRPSVQAINMLLDEVTPTGLIMPAGSPQMSLRSLSSGNESSPIHKAVRLANSHAHAAVDGHHRAASMGKAQGSHYLKAYDGQQQGWSALTSVPAAPREDKVEPASSSRLIARPNTFRRTTSYGGQDAASTAVSDAERLQNQSTSNGDRSLDGPSENTELRLAVAAAFARSKQDQGTEGKTETHGLEGDGCVHQSTNMTCVEEDMRPYSDGTPSLILPGGGRLPDQARSLLERMLDVDPNRRPTAAEVRAALEAFDRRSFAL